MPKKGRTDDTIKVVARTAAQYWAKQLQQRVDRRDQKGIPCFEDVMAVFFEHWLNDWVNSVATLPIGTQDASGRFLQGAAVVANISADPLSVLPATIYMWVLPDKVVISEDGGCSSYDLPLT